MVRFKFLTGDVDYTTYGGKWISNRQNNGEFDYWFVIELINWEEAVGERDAKEIEGKYNVAVCIVSPAEAGEKNMQAAYACCGIEDEMLETAKKSGHLAELQVEALHSYAGGSPIWDSNGNNWRDLMFQAKQEAREAAGDNLSAAMQRPVNRMGMTGRECVKLTDPTTVLKRVLDEQEEPATPEQRILGKMMGVPT